MQITLYTFNKKINSLARPTGGTTIESTIKDSRCNAMAPVITFKFDKTNEPAYNYAYIPKFGRYFFIESWTYESGVWVAYMSVDTLASFRDYIIASTQFVTRSYSDFNSYIVDGYAPIISKSATAHADGQALDMAGTYIMGISGPGNTSESVQYYAITADALNTIFTNLYRTDWKGGALSDLNLDGTGLTNDVIKAVANPVSFIVSLKYFPGIFASDFGDASTKNDIYLGWWKSGASGRPIAPVTKDGFVKNLQLLSQSFKIPSHPQKDARHMWLDDPDFTACVLQFFPFGSVMLNVRDFRADNYTVRTSGKVDLQTGEATLCVYGDKAGVVSYMTTTWGVSRTVGQLSQNYFDMASTYNDAQALMAKADYQVMDQSLTISQNIMGTGTKAADALATGNPVGALSAGIDIASGFISGFGRREAELQGKLTQINGKQTVNNAIRAQIPVHTTSGQNEGFIGFSYTPGVYCSYTLIGDVYRETMGYPLYAKRTLSSLSGYTECQAPAIEAPCTMQEKSLILQYMTTGFYIE